MSVRLKALLEKKASLAGQIRQMADKVNAEDRESATLTAEETAGWKKLNEDYKANEELLGIEQTALDVTASIAKREIDDRLRIQGGGAGAGSNRGDSRQQYERDHAMALTAWMGGRRKRVAKECYEAAERCGIDPYQEEIAFNRADTYAHSQLQRHFHSTPPQLRHTLQIGATATTLNVGTGADGGYLVAPGILMNELEINMLAFGQVRAEAEVIVTKTGEPFYWPSADDTANVGEQLAEQGSTVASTGGSLAPTVNRQAWLAWKFSSTPIKISSELLEDDVFNTAAVVGGMLGERIARILNRKYTYGAGTTTPSGITVDGSSTVTTASPTAIVADEVIKFTHSLDPAYRAGASFMMHDSTVQMLRLLKASTGQYLWSSGGLNAGITAGTPDSLNGYRVAPVNQDMPQATAGLISMAFGNFKKYKVRAVREIRLVRLNELYMENDQVGFIAFVREDGHLLNAGTNPMKLLTQHA